MFYENFTFRDFKKRTYYFFVMRPVPTKDVLKRNESELFLS